MGKEQSDSIVVVCYCSACEEIKLRYRLDITYDGYSDRELNEDGIESEICFDQENTNVHQIQCSDCTRIIKPTLHLPLDLYKMIWARCEETHTTGFGVVFKDPEDLMDIDPGELRDILFEALL